VLTLTAALAVMWGCADKPDELADTASVTVPAPGIDDPVAEWELQYLPAIDAHMEAGRLDSVILICQLGLAGDSTRIVLYNLMAGAYASQGRYELATESLQTAVRLAPEFTAGWVNLAGIHTRFGQVAEAIPYLERAAQLDSNSSAAHRRLGEVYLKSGQYARAITQIGAAIALSKEESCHGIRVNAVSPGMINAGMGMGSLQRRSPELAQQFLSTIPMRRAGEASEVAAAVVFLVSDAASYITGQNFNVNGGDRTESYQ
jgi:tetratricopeptide (TPR) repeat protein